MRVIKVKYRNTKTSNNSYIFKCKSNYFETARNSYKEHAFKYIDSMKVKLRINMNSVSSNNIYKFKKPKDIG